MDTCIENQTAQVKEKKRGISGSTVKMIAIISMLIDHVGAAIIGRIILNNNPDITGVKLVDEIGKLGMWITGHPTSAEQKLLCIYALMRVIGRLGFPIFCFLLIEGFEHTRNVKKYALRLFAFALISEIPFDLAFFGKPIAMEYQNVFFTLLIGLLVMMAFRWIQNNAKLNSVLKVTICLAVFAAGIVVAELLRTDYAGIGVFCIMCLYLTRKNKVIQTLVGCLSFSWELAALLAFIPIGFYNGKRGWNIKYFFYIFYPAHLLILYLIAFAMGLGHLGAF